MPFFAGIEPSRRGKWPYSQREAFAPVAQAVRPWPSGSCHRRNLISARSTCRAGGTTCWRAGEREVPAARAVQRSVRRPRRQGMKRFIRSGAFATGETGSFDGERALPPADPVRRTIDVSRRWQKPIFVRATRPGAGRSGSCREKEAVPLARPVRPPEKSFRRRRIGFASGKSGPATGMARQTPGEPSPPRAEKARALEEIFTGRPHLLGRAWPRPRRWVSCRSCGRRRACGNPGC